jgi:tRNA A-37 threonylcarbamoyl transferase component Bud32
MATAHTLVAGRYRLNRQLGAGGMGLVWRARDEVLGRDVAIKEVVPPAGLSETDRAELRLRTLREARTAARLNHPNVVKIYDVVHTEEWPWIVMEYVPSRSLHEVISDDGPLSPSQVARIGLAMLAALGAAHRAGVLHRDVKPGNVLIADDGRVVLTDFGLATFDDTDGALTLPGLVLGSAQYVAPERARDGTSTPESDLWSLGATLYAAVEGRSPYARSTTMATLTALATALPDPPRHAGPLKPVLAGLLRRNPKDRVRPAVAERALLRLVSTTDGGRRRIPGQRGRRAPIGSAPANPALLLLATDRTATVPDEPGRRSTHRWSPRRPWPIPGRRIAWLVAAAVMAVLLAGLGVLLVRSGQRRSALSPGPAPSAAASASPGAARPGTLVLGTTACSSTARPAPVRSMPAQPGWNALLPGFVWYLDPSGFRISVPQGWTVTSGPDGSCFREPNDTRTLAVEPYTPDGDPISHWLGQESALIAAGPPRGYTNLGIGLVPYYFLGAAQWEYTYLDATTRAVQHGLSRCFLVSAQRAYTIVWRTRQLDWQPNLDLYRAIIGSFAPAT